MNTIDGFVSKIVSDPKHMYGKWFVKVIVNAYGVESEHDAMFDTKADAESLSVGDKVQI